MVPRFKEGGQANDQTRPPSQQQRYKLVFKSHSSGQLLESRGPAIIEGWYLGEATGTAVADVLFGKVNPSGKLPISFPRSVGHLPCYYNKKPAAFRHPVYVLETNDALFPFGYGLSYTSFEYSDIKLAKEEINKNETTTLTVKLSNTGERDGYEVVQMYVRDDYSSATRPVLELKAFEKIYLEAGESKVVSFDITPDKLKFYNKDMKEVVEPGTFTISVGTSSNDLKSVSLNVVD